MKDGLHGQHFPSNDAVLPAMKHTVTCATSADFYESGHPVSFLFINGKIAQLMVVAVLKKSIL